MTRSPCRRWGDVPPTAPPMRPARNWSAEDVGTAPMRPTAGAAAPDVTDGALGMIVSASAAPYGYTVTVWTSAALLIRYHSFPGVAEIILFAAGALIGYTTVGLLVHVKLMAFSPPPAPRPVMFGMLHWFAVGIAVGAVCLLAQIPGWVAWPLGSLTATTVYLMCAAAELAFLTARGRGRGR